MTSVHETFPTHDTITLLPETAEALSELGLGDFGRVEFPERMAWVVMILCRLDDDPRLFPHGKWGTCQSLLEQLQNAAWDSARALNAERLRAKP